MRKNQGLSPAHHEVKMILSDMLEPMYQSLLPIMDEVTKLRKSELEIMFRRARTTDMEGMNKIALELKDTIARIQVMDAEIERKRTCIRAFLMLVGEKVTRARRDGEEPDFKPRLTDYEQQLLAATSELDPQPQRYEYA